MGIPLDTLSNYRMLFKGMIVIYVAVLTVAAAKDAKAFSLFNVVTFQNDACTSTSITTQSGARIGQCFTAEVCHATVLTNKYCGDVLTTEIMSVGTINTPICDCTLPFRVGIHTDGVMDAAPAANQDADDGFLQSRGVCLDYKQI